MTDVPKIVHHRLRATTPERDTLQRAHPEADVLTAFAEQALSANERDGVLQHLALCADCRDVIVLALPAMDLTVPPVEAEDDAVKTPRPDKARTNWLAWAHIHWGRLSWAALAAGIAVAVLVVGPGMQHLTKPNPQVSSLAKQTAAPPMPQAPATQVASGSIATGAVDAKPEAAAVAGQLSADKSRGMKRPQTRTGLAIGGNPQNDSSTAAKLATPAPSGALAFEAPRAMNETVEVSGASTVVTADASTDSNLMAREDAPAIRRAKPALEAEVTEPTKAAAIGGSSAQTILPLNGRNVNTLVANGAAVQATTLKQSASWTIAGGVLQRSIDSGQSWQTAARADHPLLCYANRGQEIWAGGQAGTLLHSTDGGTTWSAVGVSFKGQPLSSDITHVEMSGLSGIVLATGDHESWNSTDSGKSWEKQ